MQVALYVIKIAMEHLVCHEARSLRYAIKGGGEKNCTNSHKKILFLWLLVQFFFTAPLL